ncbi:MAG: tRNA pseudouridine synthase A [Bacteroidetes bacterium]|nr:MAG: tRNA pseudouridine synthase A [Bacteroidota bacterium]
MQTITLQVNNDIYKNLMWFLSKFKKEEIHIIQENKRFLSVQEYLQNELNNIEEGETGFIGIEQLEEELEETIRKYED